MAESRIWNQRTGCNYYITGNSVTALFSESQSRFLLTVKKENKEKFEEVTGAVLIGEVTADQTLKIVLDGENLIDTPVEKLESAWRGAIPSLL